MKLKLLTNGNEFEPYVIIHNEFHDHRKGARYVFKFPNDYGASVIKNTHSYGYEDNLWELAVLRFYSDGKFGVCYDTYITDDVLGYLTNEEVFDTLEKIFNL